MSKLYNKNSGVNYERLVDSLNDFIELCETKDLKSDEIVSQIKKKIWSICILKPEDYDKHISIMMIKAIDSVGIHTSKLDLIKKCLEYNPEVYPRTKIKNVFTIIEYTNNPEKFDTFKQNWKQLMSKQKYKN